jgi:glyceraldehyde 3-phosphate dehydrogenase
MRTDKIIGINGLGRMGKLVLWNLIAQGQKDVVINFGRKVGESKADLLEYILFDSTYGALLKNLKGRLSDDGKDDFCCNFEFDGLRIGKTLIVILEEDRNPAYIPWENYGVELVVETTGRFNYPERKIDFPGGSVRGHFESQTVKKVFITSPFKGKVLEDSVMIVHGVNHQDYDHQVHKIISNASCSTTCLAHLINPWIEALGPDCFKAIVVDIPHAKTGKQPSLDRVPATGKGDPCTWRSSNESMFISSTGAAKALPVVIPGLNKVAFSANSIREPSDSVSLAIVTLGIEDDLTGVEIKRVYDKYGSSELSWSKSNNFSGKFLGSSRAAIVDGKSCRIIPFAENFSLVKLYGWFDNEWGYVSMFMRNLKMILETI